MIDDTAITFILPATVLVHCDRESGHVKHITIWPLDSGEQMDIWDANGASSEALQRARVRVTETEWEPLKVLPESITWES